MTPEPISEALFAVVVERCQCALGRAVLQQEQGYKAQHTKLMWPQAKG